MAAHTHNIAINASRGAAVVALCMTAFVTAQAHAAPRDINSCVTITKPGSYVLSDDVVYGGAANGTCITVMVGKVNINLDGHTISWPGPHGLGTQPTAIMSANDTEHVTVQNGTVSGFGNSVKLLGSGSTVKDVHVSGPCPCNGTGIEADGVVKDNVVSVFSAPGGGIGIHVQGIAKGNYIYDARSYGMVAEADSTITDNTITGTVGTNPYQGIGLYVNCPSTVAHNTVTGSNAQNIFLNGEGCTVKDNTAP